MKTKKLFKMGLMLLACLSMACAFAFTACADTPADEGPVLHNPDWDDGEVIKEANCKTEGAKLYHCKFENCTDTKTLPIPRTNEHDWETVSSTEASCTQAGEVNKKCKVCDKTSKDTSPKLPHTWVDGKCSVCQMTQKVSFGSDELAELTNQTYTANFEIPDSVYTVMACDGSQSSDGNDKGVEVRNQGATIDDLTFTKAIRLGGRGNVDADYAFSRVIKAVYKEAGTITVYAVKNTQTKIALFSASGEVISEFDLGATVAKYTFKIAEAGTYYIGGGASGSTDIFGIVFSDVQVHVCTDWAFDHNEVEPTCYTNGKAIWKCVDPTCTETEERPVSREHSYDADNVCTVCHIDTVSSADFSELPSSISTDTSAGSIFTLMAGKGLSIKSSNASVNGVSYTQSLHLDGKLADDFGRSIKVEMPSAGGIAIVVKKDSSEVLKVINAEGNVIGTHTMASTAELWVVQIAEAGTYYVGTDVTGTAYIYSVTAEYVKPPHVCEEWTLTETITAATCHSDGKGVYACVDPDCDKTEERVIKGGHKFDENDECTVCHINTIENADYSGLTVETVSSDLTLGSNITFVATSGKTITVESKSATVNGEQYTIAINLGGKLNLPPDETSRGIKITMPSAGSIIVVAQRAKNDNTLRFTLNGTNVDTATLTSSVKVIVFTATEAGDYYIGTDTGGAYIYSVTAEYKADKSEADSGSTDLPATEATTVKYDD